eukprot:160654-Chlamydomonas_euryale.AAC.4
MGTPSASSSSSGSSSVARGGARGARGVRGRASRAIRGAPRPRRRAVDGSAADAGGDAGDEAAATEAEAGFIDPGSANAPPAIAAVAAIEELPPGPDAVAASAACQPHHRRHRQSRMLRRCQAAAATAAATERRPRGLSAALVRDAQPAKVDARVKMGLVPLALLQRHLLLRAPRRRLASSLGHQLP